MLIPSSASASTGEQTSYYRTTVLSKRERTRLAILDTAAALASEQGLESLSIGGLASRTGMSKSGLFAHFGSKEELQISTVRAAAAIFVQRVVREAEERHEPGIERLRAVLASWLDYMQRGTFAGGCFFAAAMVEMDGRPGPVRDCVAQQVTGWAGILAEYAREAIDRG